MKKNIIMGILILTALMLLIFTGCTESSSKKIFSSLSDFDGARIGSQSGAVFADFIDPIIPNVEHKYFNSLSDIVEALSSDKVDAISIDMPVAEYLVAQNTEFIIFSEEVAKDSYGFAVIKDSPLTEKGNEVLRKLIENGTVDNAKAVWFSADESIKVLPTLDYKDDFDGSAGILRYGFDSSTVPMCYLNSEGEPLGFELDIASRIAYELNMTIEFVPMTFDILLNELNSGNLDMAGGSMSITEERQKSVDFIGPHYEGGIVLVVKKEKSKEKPLIENSRLGVMVGSTNEVYAETNYPNAKIERFNNYVDSSQALLTNEIDYSMMDYTSALNFTRYNKELEIVSEFLTDEKLCLGINKNNLELAEQVSALVDKYIDDGTMNEIISHWIKEDGSDYDIADIPKLDDAPVLKVAIITTREPTTFILDGKYAGMDIELINRIAYDLNYKVEYMEMELSVLVSTTGSGEADMCMGIYKTPEREEQLLFTAPYFANPQVLIAKK